MKNQAILTAFDGDFAMYFNPCIDVSLANAVRFSSNFIFEGKDGITKLPSYRKFKKIFKYYKGLCLDKIENSQAKMLLSISMDSPNTATIVLDCTLTK